MRSVLRMRRVVPENAWDFSQLRALGLIDISPATETASSTVPRTCSAFTNRNITFMTWNLMHIVQMLRERGGVPACGNLRSGWDTDCRYDFDNPEYR